MAFFRNVQMRDENVGPVKNVWKSDEQSTFGELLTGDWTARYVLALPLDGVFAGRKSRILAKPGCRSVVNLHCVGDEVTYRETIIERKSMSNNFGKL